MSEATPNDMPGAGAETATVEPAQDAAESHAEAKAEADQKPTDGVDYWKSRARQWEEKAKDNHKRLQAVEPDAQKWQDLLDKAGGKGKNDFDPRAEIENLQRKFENAERERLRADIAREKGVNPRWVLGDTADAMRESADDYLADRAAAQPKTTTAAAPAAEVTSDKKVEGPKQLTATDLKDMTPQQIIEARNNGQLDALMGK